MLFRSVGYLDKGCFCRLFNACRDENDPLNNKPSHVPDNFAQFTADLLPKKTHSAVDAGPLLSRGVKRLGGKADVTLCVASIFYVACPSSYVTIGTEGQRVSSSNVPTTKVPVLSSAPLPLVRSSTKPVV